MSHPSYPSYRDSGVEWLGEVPEHWAVRPLKSVLTRNEGGVWGGDPEDNEGTIVLRSTEQTVDGGWSIDNPARRVLSSQERREGVLAAGDLVVTKSSGSELHIGKTSLVTHREAQLEACFSNFMQRLRCLPTFNPRLAWYLLNSPVGRQQLVFGSNTTTGLANLNGTILGAIVTPLPPLDEQRAIAAYLDRETERIDALVAKKRLLIERLEEYRTALITRTVTRGLPPEAARAAGLDPSPRLKPSGVEWLGDVPEHWEVRKLRPLLRAPTSYGVLKPEPYDEEDSVRLLRILDIARGLQDATLMRISPAQSAEYRRTVLQEGDLVLSVVGTIGECFEVPSRLAGSNLSRALARLQLGGEITPAFLRTFFRSQSFLDWTDGIVRGTAQMVLNLGQLDGLRVPVPPVVEQRAVCAYIDTESQRLDALDGQVTSAIERLREYRTALITAAVTGKIDVQESIEEARATR